MTPTRARKTNGRPWEVAAIGPLDMIGLGKGQGQSTGLGLPLNSARDLPRAGVE